jgi:uncharacterized protein YprB with RNaseH-like and TPR domain
MGRLKEFRRKLDEIQRRRTGAGGNEATRDSSVPAHRPRWTPFLASVLRRAVDLPPPPPRPAPAVLEEACPGAVIEVPGVGMAYAMRQADPGWAEQDAALGDAVSRPGSSLRERLLRGTDAEELVGDDLLFLDIETTGLGSTPLFLVGTLAFEQGELAIRQYLARDYAEEPAVLALFLDALRGRKLLVSFNGKSFDLPYIRVRLSYHRAAPPPEIPHFDVLHEARRIWRSSVPNCRLKTLEEAICGRRREADIDGADIPDAYHRFVRSGDAAEIGVIVRHNRLDLLTMAELLLRMPESS